MVGLAAIRRSIWRSRNNMHVLWKKNCQIPNSDHLLGFLFYFLLGITKKIRSSVEAAEALEKTALAFHCNTRVLNLGFN